MEKLPKKGRIAKERKILKRKTFELLVVERDKTFSIPTYLTYHT
jgi:hypothetical protein